MGSKLFDENGTELKGLTRAVATVAAGLPVRIEAEYVCASFAVEGIVRHYFIDPASGDLKEVRRIEFADGSEWSA